MCCASGWRAPVAEDELLADAYRLRWQGALVTLAALLLSLCLNAQAQATEGPATALQSLQTLDDSQIAARPLSIRAFATHEGTRVLFIETRALPIVDISVRFSAGSSRDDASPGLANLTLKLLNQGVAGMDAKAIAETFDQLGAQLTFWRARRLSRQKWVARSAA